MVPPSGFFAQLDIGAVGRPNRRRVPVCPLRWIPAFAGMTVGVHTSEWERDDGGAAAGAFLSAIRVICWVMVYRCKIMSAGLGASEEY